MEDQFRISLNEKLNELRADELLPAFSRADTWSEIETLLHAPAHKRRVVPVWKIAAAAALAGLLIGGVSVRILSGNGRSAPTISHQFFAPKAIPVRPGAEPLRQPDAEELAAKPAHRAKYLPARSATPALPSLPPEPSEPSLQSSADSRTATTITRSSSPRAIHLLDIDAVSRTALLNDRASAPEKQSVAEFMMVRTMPSPQQPEPPAAILPLFR